MAAPKQTDPQMKIRLPPELKALIEAAADQNNRSQNAEIISRLEMSFAMPSASADVPSETVQKVAEDLIRYMAATGWRPPESDAQD